MGNALGGVIVASLTLPQRELFERLKEKTQTVTDGSMIKKALEMMCKEEGVQ